MLKYATECQSSLFPVRERRKKTWSPQMVVAGGTEEQWVGEVEIVSKIYVYSLREMTYE